MNAPQQKLGSPLTTILLAGILVALIALILVIVWPKPEGPQITNGGDVPEGQKFRRGDVEKSGSLPPKPSSEVDTGRVQQTYKPGRSYRSLLQVSANAQGEHKDWGITTQHQMQYVAEAQILRTIESNDGQTIVLVQEFERARSISAWSKLTGLSFELPTGFQTILDLAGTSLTGAVPGWTETSVQGANAMFKNDAVLGFLDQLARDESAKLRTFFDTFEGKKVRITYVNGEGVTELEAIRGKLDQEERDMIMATSVISDAYILPDLDSQPGDTWTIHGQDIPQILDPSLRATVSGSLTARRGKDGGTPNRPTAEVILDRGILRLHKADGSAATQAQWAPRGKMSFDFQDGIVTSAELGGEFRIEERSTDHLIFEAEWSVEPEYQVQYNNEVVR